VSGHDDERAGEGPRDTTELTRRARTRAARAVGVAIVALASIAAALGVGRTIPMPRDADQVAPADSGAVAARAEAVLDGLTSRVHACMGRAGGTALVRATLRSDGAVESVRIEGTVVEGSRMARCIEDAVRTAAFPAFRERAVELQHTYHRDPVEPSPSRDPYDDPLAPLPSL
jgi:hypothetical protein